MTDLLPLRRKIGSLRRWRWLVRSVAAYAALASLILWGLAGVFLVDFAFFKLFVSSLDVAQRIVVELLAVIAVILGYRHWSRPLVNVHETETDVALMVENQHGIANDLVAAIQFDSRQSVTWGSAGLKQAVIQRATSLASRLDFFEQFTFQPMGRRLAILATTVFVLAGACALLPRHAEAFVDRILLGSTTYPTTTIIEQAFVNDQIVLDESEPDVQPQPVTVAEGNPVEFAVRCTGGAGSSQVIAMTTTGKEPQRRLISMQLLSSRDRLRRLEEAHRWIEQQSADESFVPPDTTVLQHVRALLRYDGLPIAQQLASSADLPSSWAEAARRVDALVSGWPAGELKDELFVGRLGNLTDTFEYTLQLGDARTALARVVMIPRPMIELEIATSTPAYARGRHSTQTPAQARQVSVLEGSDVHITIESANGKSLERAWITATTDEAERFEMVPVNEQRLQWRLPDSCPLFQSIQQPIRFTIQVVDEDRLSLIEPVVGAVRLHADRVPVGKANVIHRVFLPTARPVIDYTANDDFGISEIDLHVSVDRKIDRVEGQESDAGFPNPTRREAGEADVSSENARAADLRVAERTARRTTVPIPGFESAVVAPNLPVTGQFPLDLTPFDLEPGDMVKLILRIRDYRGQSVGKTFDTEPVILEIADSSRVLEVNSELDRRIEQQIDEIKNRLLN